MILSFFPYLLTLLTAHAQSHLTIQSFEPQKNTALVSLPSATTQVKVGDEYFVETPYGKCFIQVSEVMRDFFRLNTEQCGREHITNGKALFAKEKVLIERTITTETFEPLPNDSVNVPLDFIDADFFKNYMHDRLSIYASYLTGKNISGTAPIGDQTTIGDFKTSNTIALGAEYKILTFMSNFAWSSGFSYNLPRSFGAYTLATTNGESTQRFNNDPTLSLFSVFTNARYAFNEQLFAHLGMNYLLASSNDTAGSMSGDFGFHLGARYYPLKNVFVDGQINFYNLDYTVNNITSDFSLTELDLKAGYTF